MFVNPERAVIDGVTVLRQAEAILRDRPGLCPAAPVSPKPVVRGGRHWIGPAKLKPSECDSAFLIDAEFDAFANRALSGGWQPRSRNDAKPDDLILAATAGYSMEPVLLEGDQIWFDPYLAADDGDIVLVHVSESRLKEMITGTRSNAKSLAAYGHRMSNLVVKCLRHFAGRQVIYWGQGAYVLGDNKILGVLHHVIR